MKTLSSVLLFLVSIGPGAVQGFAPRPNFNLNRSNSSLAMNNPLQNIFTLLKDGKKGLVKSLAGEYDSVSAKGILDAKKAKYTVVELDTDPEGKAIRAEMMEMIGRSSVPALWIKGEFCGGCNEGGPYGGIANMSESGKLDEMLKAVGAM
ncbi:hypothetical protein CTEN210_14765 [Chaetoceros tenuissimus]|uniref:Glutaredoxin domain-containing protein n=1 Tax=Chaetoceros tenuissimus TaxID=426638 RepID=A0AAD3D936_9STRA|nr:hypothetical protein CTEN210_14765 [Chaetoceros tenuissimus]